VRRQTRTYILSSVGAILGALLAGLYVLRFMDVEGCKTSFDVTCTENFIRLPGIVFSWPVALAIVMTFGALLGAILGHAIGHRAERATPRNRQLILLGVTTLLIVLAGVAGGRFMR
jgi:hypothetical protein